MTSNSPSNKWSTAFVVLTAFTLAGCALSADGFQDEDIAGKAEAPDTALVRSLLTGLGAVDASRKPIEYKPRSPLVVPPGRGLPSPETGKTKLTSADGWPDDEEAREERIRRVRAADPDRGRDDGTTSVRLSGKTWTPEELARYRIRGAGKKGIDEERYKTLRDSEDGRRLTKKELGETIETGKTKKTGKRVRLTDPPVAYRTPAATAPMAESDKKEKKKKFDVMDRAIGGYRHNN